jgi:hypothetical protein
MKRALGIRHFSLKRLTGEDSVIGALEDVLRKAPDTEISLHRGAPFHLRGIWTQERGLVYQGMMNEGGL